MGKNTSLARAMMTSTKRILHLMATNFYGGPEKQIVEHLRNIDRDKFLPVVCSFIEKGNPNEFLNKASDVGISAHEVVMPSPVDMSALTKLIRLIRDNEIDLMCVHGYKSCVMGWLAARYLRVPILAFSRGYTSENLKIAFYNWLERKFLGRMDGIIAVSKGQLEKLEKLKVRNKKTWVVHNAIRVNNTSPDKAVEKRRDIFNLLGIPADGKLVVAAGRFSPEKGHRYLVAAISQMGEKAKKVYFVFCGDGPCRIDLEKQAKTAGILKNCRFPGFRKDLQNFFHAMDLMVLPSLSEGLPNVILEAFALKKPVVATWVGGVPEVVDDGVSGFLSPPADPQRLAELITIALSDKKRMEEMGIAGFDKVKRAFSVEGQTQSLELIYNEFLSDTHHA